MARSFEECVDAVAKAGKVGHRAALDLLQQVHDRAEAAGAGPDDYLKAASDLARETIATAQQDRIDAARNAAARATMLERAETEAEGRITPARSGLVARLTRTTNVSANLIPGSTRLGLADGLRSLLHYMPGAKQHDNAESMWVGLSRQLISPLGNRLRQLGLEKAAVSDGLRHEVAEAMWRLNGGTPDPTMTISRDAQQIAEAFWKPLDLIKERQNALGAQIGDAVDYVTHTTWDSRQLRLAAGPGASADAAFAAWKARELPRMAEKTFENIEDREKFLRSVYDATASGIHLRAGGAVGEGAFGDYVPPQYEGTRNIARSASQHRVVYWKDATAWADHMNEFGGGHSLYANVVRTLDTGARRAALMHYFGTNPAANLETVIKHLTEQHRTSGELGALQRQFEGVRNVMGRLDGTMNMPIHEDAGNLTNQLLSAEAVSHLGGVSLTHLSAAPATFSSEMIHHGVGRLETMANIARSLTMNRGTAEAQEALADAAAYAHGYTLAIHRAGTAGEVWRADGFPGIVSWLSAHFMRLTGLPQILDSLQAQAVKSVLMSRLGRQIDQDFESVEPHQKAGLSAYGIGAEEWRLLRGSDAPTRVEGNRWMVPSDALHTNAAEVEALLRGRGLLADGAAPDAVARAVKQFQWELGDKVLMYLNDAGDRGAVRPGVRERAMILGNSRPGDPSYFLKRAVSQFKMWPLAAVNQILARDIATSLSKREIATNIFALLALSTVGGAMRMSVNDLASGRPQRDYRNPMTLLAALAQGGGLGIYGDFLFGETSRMSTGLASTLGGPIAGDAERFWNLFTRFRNDIKENPGKAMQHMWPDLAHLMVGHVPFGNLIYLKGALDYLLWYHLYEAASPGWWNRTNQRLIKEQGRGMVGYHPGGKIPYTPFALGQ